MSEGWKLWYISKISLQQNSPINKKEKQTAWINPFALRLPEVIVSQVWKETRCYQNLTKWLFSFFFFSQNYAVPSRLKCSMGMYWFQWKGVCSSWYIFVTCKERCQIKKLIFPIWKQILSHNFVLWHWFEGFGSVPAQTRNTLQNEIAIVQKAQLRNPRSVPAWHFCGWKHIDIDVGTFLFACTTADCWSSFKHY